MSQVSYPVKYLAPATADWVTFTQYRDEEVNWDCCWWLLSLSGLQHHHEFNESSWSGTMWLEFHYLTELGPVWYLSTGLIFLWEERIQIAPLWASSSENTFILVAYLIWTLKNTQITRRTIYLGNAADSLMFAEKRQSKSAKLYIVKIWEKAE